MSVTIIAPGTESEEAYRASGAWGSTLISTFRRSPRLAHLIRTGAWKPEPTTSMVFGTRFHHLMDPNGHFTERHRVGPDVDKRSKAWKDAEAAAAKDGVELVGTEDWQALHAMRESVLANPVAASLIEAAEHEVGVRMDAPMGPFQLQCRVDALRRWTHCVDLKTTSDLDDAIRSVLTYGYHRQAALYRWLVAHACGELLPFSFIFVEKAAPLYRCRVLELTDDFLALGWSEVEETLQEVADRSLKDDWRDHDHVTVVAPPAWMTTTKRPAAA